MNASQRPSCSSDTHSLGWCACSMWPGPQITVAISAPWNSAASVPNYTLPTSAWPLQWCAIVAISEPSCVSMPGSVERASKSM